VFGRTGKRIHDAYRYYDRDALAEACKYSSPEVQGSVGSRPSVTSWQGVTRRNVGDSFSNPSRYFSIPGLVRERERDIHSVEDSSERSDISIVGGGGFIKPESIGELERIAKTARKAIAWGIGHNYHNQGDPSIPAKLEYPDELLSKFALVGLRDDPQGHDYDWVPCASCMHPALGVNYPIEHEVVIYEHWRAPIEIPHLPRMSNKHTDMVGAIKFLSSGSLILTNSYHGLYWGTLLQRRVIAFPFSTKFFTLKHKQPLCLPEEWEGHQQYAQVYPDALTECRDANVAFYKKVLRMIDSWT
jgi:hypothetical protein